MRGTGTNFMTFLLSLDYDCLRHRSTLISVHHPREKRSPGQQPESPVLRQRLGMFEEVGRTRAMSMSMGPKARPQRKRTHSMGIVQINKITRFFRPAQDYSKQV